MDLELKRRVDALRRPLELAAADNFRGVRKVQGLGNALRAGVDAILAKQAVEGMEKWRAILGRWEQLDEDSQAVEVARGLRLIALFPRDRDVGASRPVPKPTFELPPLPATAPSSGARTAPDAGPSAAVSAAKTKSAKSSHAGTAPATGSATSENRTGPDARASAAPPTSETKSAKSSREVAGRRVPATSLGSSPHAIATAPEVIAAAPEKPVRVKAARIEVPADPMAAPTNTLPGIGPALAERLAERGLATVEHLLWMVPRRYDDVRDARPLADVTRMEEGERATFVARVASSRMIFGRGRRWAEVRLGAIDLAEPASVLVRWFNVFGGIEKRMPEGASVALSGIVKRRNGRVELANPDVLGIEIPEGPKKAMPSILSRYPDVPGVPPSRLRAACAAACARVAEHVEDGVPAAVEESAGLPSLAETLSHLHAPPADLPREEVAALNEGTSRWQRRLAFGELFALGVAITLRRRARRADAAVACRRARDFDKLLSKSLPFALTGAQRRSVDELGADLGERAPMNRLLQGDVGAGKTAVAFAAALQVARAKRQTAVMAPTELLAEQHAETWRRWAKPAGLRVELLTASTPKGVRASLLALLAAGELDVVIGTHALLAEGVGFSALGLVVIDEQHRFGVAQRARLRDKGDGQGAPHLLVMTATPIPRTLALTAYGDLDTSILDELPPGRKPVATRVLSGARGRTAAYQLIGERVAAGERAYVVCPKVEPTDPEDDDDVPQGRVFKDATTTADEVAAALPRARVGLVHGRLDSEARDRVMRAFKAGELDVLVATTVIEVGVDVPAATVMVIHDAERFGLAQLHQLRGRVGRGGDASHCLLLSQGANGELAAQRLAALAATNDGFRIAEEDLRLRGPGELLGPQQAGVPRLRFGDLAQHTELLLAARRHAEAVLVEDPALVRPENAALRRALARRLAQSVYGAEAG